MEGLQGCADVGHKVAIRIISRRIFCRPKAIQQWPEFLVHIFGDRLEKLRFRNTLQIDIHGIEFVEWIVKLVQALLELMLNRGFANSALTVN